MIFHLVLYLCLVMGQCWNQSAEGIQEVHEGELWPSDLETVPEQSRVATPDQLPAPWNVERSQL